MSRSWSSLVIYTLDWAGPLGSHLLAQPSPRGPRRSGARAAGEAIAGTLGPWGTGVGWCGRLVRAWEPRPGGVGARGGESADSAPRRLGGSRVLGPGSWPLARVEHVVLAYLRPLASPLLPAWLLGPLWGLLGALAARAARPRARHCPGAAPAAPPRPRRSHGRGAWCAPGRATARCSHLAQGPIADPSRETWLLPVQSRALRALGSAAWRSAASRPTQCALVSKLGRVPGPPRQ